MLGTMMRFRLDQQEGPVVAIPIRRTTFTWYPDREPRSAAWARIKIHIQGDLDRIHAGHMLARQIAPRRARPGYAQGQQIIQAAQRGTGHAELARQYGMSRQRVRDIIRSAPPPRGPFRFRPAWRAGSASGPDGVSP
jgi:hypothetical protein